MLAHGEYLADRQLQVLLLEKHRSLLLARLDHLLITLVEGLQWFVLK
jgi:hypothetical protein